MKIGVGVMVWPAPSWRQAARRRRTYLGRRTE